MDKHHQIALRRIFRGVAEELAHQRNIPQQRHLRDGLFGDILHQATEYHRLPTVHHHFIIDGSGVEGGAKAGIFGRVGIYAGDFLLNLQVDHVAVVDLRHNFQLGAHRFTLDGVKDVVAAGGLGTGQYRHILTHVERGLFVIQRHHARRGENVVFGAGGESRHQGAEITVKEAGRQPGEGGPLHRAVLDLTDRQPGRTKLYAAMLAGPLHAEIQTVSVLNFGNDGLHQHLRSADIELIDDLLKGIHDVRLGGNHQRIRRFVSGDIQLISAAGGFHFRRTGFVFQLLANAGQHRHHLRGVGIFQIEDAGVALVILLTIQLPHQRTGARPRIFRPADHQTVGLIIGHHFGGELRRVLPFLLFVIEVVQHIR